MALHTRIRRAHIHESSNNSCALQQKRTMYVVTTKKINSSCSSSLTHVENGGKNSRMKNSGPHKKYMYSEIITHLLKRGKMDWKKCYTKEKILRSSGHILLKSSSLKGMIFGKQVVTWNAIHLKSENMSNNHFWNISFSIESFNLKQKKRYFLLPFLW